jgi:hypothetical protein
MAISKVAVSALESVRGLIKLLPSFSRKEVDELITAELKGRRRRSIVIRLAQRAAKLDADSTYLKVMKEFNNGS